LWQKKRQPKEFIIYKAETSQIPSRSEFWTIPSGEAIYKNDLIGLEFDPARGQEA
jgi:hypothetical protein